MAIAAVIGDKLVGVNDLGATFEQHQAELDSYLFSAEPDTAFELEVTGGVSLGHQDLARARQGATEVIPYEAIGLGKPLTVMLESIYVGDYPDTLRWVPGENLGDVLVTSAHRPFQNFEAAPRAVHMLRRQSPRRVHLEQNAAEHGSRLLYYTPAATDSSILFTIEISVDREFSQQLGDSLAKAVASAGALPVFATAAPYLIAASVAIPLATKAANLLASPRPYFAETVNVNFALAGIEAAQARALVLYPGDDEARFAGYTLGRDHLLRDAAGEPYGDELPYAVVSLDGTTHTDLEGWTAQAASAVLLERFYNPDERLSSALDLSIEALKFYNDMKYQKRAIGMLLEAAAAGTDAEKTRLEKLADALIKNIQDDDIRKSAEAKRAG